MSTTRQVEDFLAAANYQAYRKRKTFDGDYNLDFSKQGLDDEKVVELVKSFDKLVSPVTKVNFSGNAIGVRGIQAIGLWVSKSPVITEVQIDDKLMTNAPRKICAIL